MALRGQVVDFVRSHFKEYRDQAVNIKDISIVHMKLQRSYNVCTTGCCTRVHFLIQAMHKQMLDATLVESRCVALDAVNFIALRNNMSHIRIR